MKRDIVLVDPERAGPQPGPQLGLGCLEAALAAKGCSCEVIAASEVDRHLSSSDVFGISVMDHTYASAREITARLEGRTVIWGGWTPTASPERVLRENPGVEYVVLGEGERRLLELLAALRRGEAPARSDGIAYRQGADGIVVRPPEGFLKLDDLPMPTNPCLVIAGACVLIEIARGCHGRCGYCQESHPMRFKSPGRVMEEIAYWHDRGHRLFYLGNANSLANGRQIRELVGLLEERALRCSLIMLGRPDDVVRNRQAIIELFSSEVVQVHTLEIGIEAATQHALDLLRRRSTPEVNRAALSLLLDLKQRWSSNVTICANMILFSHFDMTMEDLVENVRFIGECRCSGQTLSLQLYGVAGTPIWRQMVGRGFEPRPELAGQIRDYPFADPNVDRLYRRLVAAPIEALMASSRYTPAAYRELRRSIYQTVLSCADSPDPRAAIRNLLS